MMANREDIDILYDRPMDISTRLWLSIQPKFFILNILTVQDIDYMHKIATSVKLAGNPSKKKELITQVMTYRNCKRIACGTNRLVFKYMEDQSTVIKVAFDRVAINDNLREYKNQEFLKPFCAKCFEVTPCGTVGIFERVYPVVNREQFMSIADRVFDIIVNCFLGKYVLADFGTNYYKNWGVRKGMGPVILDYPYLYELDSGKLYCNKPDPKSPTGICHGDIDYDAGFNYLVCEKCGKVYLASEVSKADSKRGGIIVEREEHYMTITIEKNGKTIVLGDEKETTTYKKMTRKERKLKKDMKDFSITIERGDHSETTGEEPVSKVETPVEEPIEFTETPIDQGESNLRTDDCKNIEVTIVTRNGDKYVGKSNEFDYENPYGSMNIYGTGAEYVGNIYEEDKPETKKVPEYNEEEAEVPEEVSAEEDTEVVYSDDDSMGSTLSEALKQINMINEKEREEASTSDSRVISADNADYYETEDEDDVLSEFF